MPRPQLANLGGDDLLELLGEGRALEQHPADFLPKGAHVPVLDAAHLGVEVAGEGLFDGEQLHEVAPAQLCRQRRHNFLNRETLGELDGAVECTKAESPAKLSRQFLRHCRKNLFPTKAGTGGSGDGTKARTCSPPLAVMW